MLQHPSLAASEPFEQSEGIAQISERLLPVPFVAIEHPQSNAPAAGAISDGQIDVFDRQLQAIAAGHRLLSDILFSR
jgi:hypothetical protein